ncbi:MAG: methylated-DNA--[protein]-cysteine S-methyltransferase [Clostridiaceae bacterium]|jgi:methylated-DNA-protein-cysteine methyltransferase-like protein|nr:methylated-DNA--[protein]-cysteine S-methyltransferase [Clostridiaceae bacterium]
MEADTFYDRIYRLVARVPAGKVATYGQLAALAGNPRAARQAALALSRTPEYLAIPTHRIVNQAGTLAPDHVFGGRRRQRDRLLAEHVPFTADGRVDVDACLWHPDR